LYKSSHVVLEVRTTYLETTTFYPKGLSCLAWLSVELLQSNSAKLDLHGLARV